MLRPSTQRTGYNGARGSGYCYKGVLKDDKGSIVWTCLHEHGNRDDNEYLRPPFSYREFPTKLSALNCARSVLKSQSAEI